MAQLIGASMTLDNLKKIVSVMEAKAAKGDVNGGKYFNLTISVNDDAPRFRQNVSITAEQTKEAREAKAPKFYVGNGRTFWAGNGEFVPPKEDAAPAAAVTGATAGDDEPDLPFIITLLISSALMLQTLPF